MTKLWKVRGKMRKTLRKLRQICVKNEESYEKNCVKLGKSEESEERKWKRWESKNDDMLNQRTKKSKGFLCNVRKIFVFFRES